MPPKWKYVLANPALIPDNANNVAERVQQLMGDYVPVDDDEDTQRIRAVETRLLTVLGSLHGKETVTAEEIKPLVQAASEYYAVNMTHLVNGVHRLCFNMERDREIPDNELPSLSGQFEKAFHEIWKSLDDLRKNQENGGGFHAFLGGLENFMYKMTNPTGNGGIDLVRVVHTTFRPGKVVTRLGQEEEEMEEEEPGEVVFQLPAIRIVNDVGVSLWPLYPMIVNMRETEVQPSMFAREQYFWEQWKAERLANFLPVARKHVRRDET